MKVPRLKRLIEIKDGHAALVCDTTLSGLGVAISLGRRGVPVIGVGPNPRAEATFSRYCTTLVSPNPETQGVEYIAFLVELGRRFKRKPVLFPAGDIVALLLCKNRSVLEPQYLLPMSDYSSVEILGSKDRFKEEMERLGFPHPRTYIPGKPYPVAELGDKMDYPCLVKPVHSQRFTAQYNTKAFLANNRQELWAAYDRATEDRHEVIVQELIPGPDSNLYLVHGYFNKDSEPLGIFTLRRIRQYPRGFGNGSMCESIWISALALQVAEFIRAIHYQGIIDAELKLDPRDGRFKFIEINPRPGWQNRLSARCGVNLPHLAYLDATGANVPKPPLPPNGVKWVLMHADMKSAWEAMRKGQLELGDYIRSFRGPIEWAFFAWDDPKPFLAALKGSVLAGLRKAFRVLWRKAWLRRERSRNPLHQEIAQRAGSDAAMPEERKLW